MARRLVVAPVAAVASPTTLPVLGPGQPIQIRPSEGAPEFHQVVLSDIGLDQLSMFLRAYVQTTPGGKERLEVVKRQPAGQITPGGFTPCTTS